MKLVIITDTGAQIEARCDGCRHWEPPKHDVFGTCEHNEIEGSTKWCGTLLPVADFFCPLFEAKP